MFQCCCAGRDTPAFECHAVILWSRSRHCTRKILNHRKACDNMYAGWSGRSLPHGHHLQTQENLSRCGGKPFCGHARTRARQHSRVLAVIPQQQTRQAAAAAAARSKRDSRPKDWFFTQRGQQDWVRNPALSSLWLMFAT